jgi:hypothetical protein
MESLYTIQQTAKRIRLLSAFAGVLAYPAALGFAWLWLQEGQHRGLLGFALIWLLVAGVTLRLYAQFLRWWHEDALSQLKLRAERGSGARHERRAAPSKSRLTHQAKDDPTSGLDSFTGSPSVVELSPFAQTSRRRARMAIAA